MFTDFFCKVNYLLNSYDVKSKVFCDPNSEKMKYTVDTLCQNKAKAKFKKKMNFQANFLPIFTIYKVFFSPSFAAT